ncbi:MAG TPA: hypothetical protein VFQ52_02050 [Rhizomicrobium sp.]|nr:hypothetical protein [Rhizomicrobium sp.]
MQALFGLLTGGGAAAGATTGAAAGATAASSFSLSTLLQGGATVLGMAQAISAGNAQAEAYELEAQDAERQKPLETLQGISRRTALKRAAADAIGDQDVAYASSGVDLSFGTPAQARSDALRELDMGVTVDNGTQETRQVRLDERARNYRRMAGRAKSAGIFDALSMGATGFSSIYDRV